MQRPNGQPIPPTNGGGGQRNVSASPTSNPQHPLAKSPAGRPPNRSGGGGGGEGSRAGGLLPRSLSTDIESNLPPRGRSPHTAAASSSLSSSSSSSSSSSERSVPAALS